MKHKCFYLVGYHGCGKTTQANKLEKEFPHLNYVGGKSGLDAISSVDKFIHEIKNSKTDIVIHGCTFQIPINFLRLSRLTDLHVIVLQTKPKIVEERTYKRGATEYNVDKYIRYYRFIKRLPELKKEFTFKLSIVDNNRDIDSVYQDIKKCVQS